jgi:hypothetical protein
MSPPYVLDHSGLRCTLRPLDRTGPAVLGAILAPGALVVLTFLFRSWCLMVGFSVGIIALVAQWLWGRAHTELCCDGRALEWRRCWGPLRGPERRVSLLDLKAIGAVEGYLLLEPRLGPLSPVALDARGLDPRALAHLASYLHQAIDQAERFRGDVPSEQTWAAAALVDPRE